MGQNKLGRWLWDMVNTMVQRQQKSESFAAIHCTISSALLFCCVAAWDGLRNPSHAFVTGVSCESREGVRVIHGSVSSGHPI